MNAAPENPVLLEISGRVGQPCQLRFADLVAIDAGHQIADVSTLTPGKQGGAITLAGLLELAQIEPDAQWLGLHSSSDDFHASIPLADIRERAFLIYQFDGAPLPAAAGGPCRFFIPEHAACRTDMIDECANVKFVDHIELTTDRGHDNRPTDEDQHAALHKK